MNTSPIAKLAGRNIAWMTAVGIIRKDMKVIDAQGICLGLIKAVREEEVLLAGNGSYDFIALGQIDAVNNDGVLVSGRENVATRLTS